MRKEIERLYNVVERGCDTSPVRPKKWNLTIGGKIDYIMSDTKGRDIGLEIKVHQHCGRFMALKMNGYKKKNKLHKMIIVVCGNYDETFVAYCKLKDIDAFTVDGETAEGGLMLSPIKL